MDLPRRCTSATQVDKRCSIDCASVPPLGLLLGASLSCQLDVKIEFSAVGFLGTKNCDFEFGVDFCARVGVVG